MYQLSELAIKAILKEWHPREYRPPYTDVQQWIESIESLCNQYGIPDIQRLQCAVGFIKKGLRQALVDVAERFGIVHWNQFKGFLVIFDGKGEFDLYLATTDLGPVEDFRNNWERKGPCYALVYVYANPSQQSFHSGRGIPNTPEPPSS